MTWQIVPKQSQIQFTVRHMLISKVRGHFLHLSNSIDYDEENPDNTTVQITIDAASINTGDKQRDSYLLSSAFLNVASHPNLTFASKRVQQINARYGRLNGDLTIQNITHEVILQVRRTDRTKKSETPARAGLAPFFQFQIP